MASFAGISAAGKSLERLLTACFTEEQPVPGKQTRALLVRTEDFAQSNGALSFTLPALTLYLYRVDFNKTTRAAWSGVGHLDGRGHLPLDLHFLLTAWADNAEYEYRIIGKTMQCLETTPILNGPLLYPDPTADWAPNEAIQLVLEEISTEAVMRTFDSLPTDYKLSIPYIARVIRLDSRVSYASPTVTSVTSGIKPSSSP
ncbi:DUF4255 domain-containing protein [Hyalangium versicolor]|uniref:DUF4255 domain-containing protein n=1 Tax=Hyalangium versicolor TaxID=2861190 RepID=UPI001CCDE116|nr:DUF4255 domain-containing protein [Hyalangium versicolor]